MGTSQFREYNAFLGIDLDFQGFEAEVAALPGKYAADKGGELYVALLNDQPVGCAAFYAFEPGNIAELKRLYVQPTAQGHGLGKQLLQTAIADVTARGYHTLYLDSLHRLIAARKLYEQLGFVDIPPYNHNSHADAYYMTKPLTL